MKNLNIKENKDFKGTIAILNSVPATIPIMKAAILEYLPNANIINFLDDSILPEIKKYPSLMPYVYEKFLTFAKFAERQKADIIVNACSTMGEFSTYATSKLFVPLVRIDDAVTDVICEDSHSIMVLATLSTTLAPSTNIIHAKAHDTAIVDSALLEDAALLNAAGDKEGHDKAIAAKINSIAENYDSIMLAQASMADAIKYVDEKYIPKVYTSIPYCIAQIVNLASKI